MLETLNTDLEGLQKKDPSQRAKQVNRCQNKLIEIRTRIEAFELETLQLDKYAQIKHKETLKSLQAQYKDMKSQFDKKRAENKNEMNAAVAIPIEKNLDEMTGQELVQTGHNVQQKGQDALKRILGQVEGANTHADQINLALHAQEETIARTKEKVYDVQSQLKRAREYLRYFAKQVYTDKLLMCMIFLCVVAIIVIIIMKIVKKQHLTTATDIINGVTNSS